MNRVSLSGVCFNLLLVFGAAMVLMFAPTVRAGDIDRLVKEEARGQAAISEYLSATLAEDARRELTHALTADERFQRGEPARELALRALASLVVENGQLALEEQGQVRLLLEAAVDTELSALTRTEVIQRMPVMAALAPEQTAEAFVSLLAAEDPYVLLFALDAVARWDGLDEKFAPGLLAIATDPVNAVPGAWARAGEAVPGAWARAGEQDRRDAQNWPMAQDKLMSSQHRIRGLAAAAWMMASDPRDVLDFLRDHPIERGDIWAGALLQTLIPTGSPFWTAEVELQRQWLELLARLFERADTIAVAECCTIPVMIQAAYRRDALIGHVRVVVEQVAKTHGADASVSQKAAAGLKVLDMIRVQAAPAGEG